jgi:hypothetical protein
MPESFIHTFAGSRKVNVTRAGIALFNAQWPCSELRPSRSYWFEFDTAGDLVDTDCPQHDDGPAASALADDCKAYLEDGAIPAWCDYE